MKIDKNFIEILQDSINSSHIEIPKDIDDMEELLYFLVNYNGTDIDKVHKIMQDEPSELFVLKDVSIKEDHSNELSLFIVFKLNKKYKNTNKKQRDIFIKKLNEEINKYSDKFFHTCHYYPYISLSS